MMALDRLAVTIMVTDDERAELDTGRHRRWSFIPAIHPDSLRLAIEANIPAQHA
jgi:hypothetical protein